MQQKLRDFLSSYGLMFLGLCLLIVSSIGLNTRSIKQENNFIIKETLELDSKELALNNFNNQKPIVPLPKNYISQPRKISAISALVVDDESGAVLYSKNSKEVRSLASITKLISALVLLDLDINFSSTTVVQRSDKDNNSHHIDLGEKFTFKDLWTVALVGSSNTAINTLVRETGLTRENFIILMNKKAKELKMKSAVFTDPTGLDDGNKANVYDVSLLLKEALKHKEISTAIHTGHFKLKPLNSKKSRTVWSTDWLLTKWVPNNFKEKNIAGKTGYIIKSDYNFAVYFIDDAGRSLRVVILGSKTNKKRFEEARDLALWAYNTFVWPNESGYTELAQ